MKCNHIHSTVVDSRKDEINGTIKRTRVCKDCGLRFYTTEYLIETPSGSRISALTEKLKELTEKNLQLESKIYKIKRILSDKG